jgi:hypothetical protein
MLTIEESKEDYSEIECSPISEDAILPFVIGLDTGNSNLYPETNENQRFCYIITGIGTENSKFADLSHLIFGICDQILQDEIVNIAVTIDGVEQDVCLEEGEGVQLKARQSSDKISEYPGLELDMNLDKNHGKMSLSFELTHTYPIGRIKVYLVGSNAVTDEVSIYGPVSQEVQECYVNTYQDASVYIPVEIIPRADSGEIKASCYAEPTVTVHEDRTRSKYCFTIIQPICVEIPLEFSAEALIGSLHVKCEEETGPICESVLEETGPECESVLEETGPECESVYEETGPECESVYEEIDKEEEPVLEAIGRGSSSEQEPLKSNPTSYNYYKIFF